VLSHQIDADSFTLPRLRIDAHLEGHRFAGGDLVALAQRGDVKENIAAPSSGLMNPKPLSSLNILILPLGMLFLTRFQIST
jgi:hypothetical protein